MAPQPVYETPDQRERRLAREGEARARLSTTSSYGTMGMSPTQIGPRVGTPIPAPSRVSSHYPYARGSQINYPINPATTSTLLHNVSATQPGSVLANRPTTGGGRGGAAAGAAGKGKKLDPNAGKVLPGLPPELQRWYEEQLSMARTEEQQRIAQEELAKRSALRQTAAQGRQARALAAGRAVDVGAAMAESGLGSSPALLGSAMDAVYGAGRAQELDAESARTQALQNFLQQEQDILGAGRRRKSELEDWRALQIAALTNADLAKLIGMTPGGKK